MRRQRHASSSLPSFFPCPRLLFSFAVYRDTFAREYSMTACDIGLSASTIVTASAAQRLASAPQHCCHAEYCLQRRTRQPTGMVATSTGTPFIILRQNALCLPPRATVVAASLRCHTADEQKASADITLIRKSFSPSLFLSFLPAAAQMKVGGRLHRALTKYRRGRANAGMCVAARSTLSVVPHGMPPRLSCALLPSARRQNIVVIPTTCLAMV